MEAEAWEARKSREYPWKDFWAAEGEGRQSAEGLVGGYDRQIIDIFEASLVGLSYGWGDKVPITIILFGFLLIILGFGMGVFFIVGGVCWWTVLFDPPDGRYVPSFWLVKRYLGERYLRVMYITTGILLTLVACCGGIHVVRNTAGVVGTSSRLLCARAHRWSTKQGTLNVMGQQQGEEVFYATLLLSARRGK